MGSNPTSAYVFRNFVSYLRFDGSEINFGNRLTLTQHVVLQLD